MSIKKSRSRKQSRQPSNFELNRSRHDTDIFDKRGDSAVSFKINGMFHSAKHDGTGLNLLRISNANLAGALFTLSRTGKQIVCTFSGPIDAPEYTLYTVEGKGWPDRPIVRGRDTEIKEAGTIKLIFDVVASNINVTASLRWDLVDPLRPSPLPPPSHKESFTVILSPLVSVVCDP